MIASESDPISLQTDPIMSHDTATQVPGCWANNDGSWRARLTPREERRPCITPDPPSSEGNLKSPRMRTCAVALRLIKNVIADSCGGQVLGRALSQWCHQLSMLSSRGLQEMDSIDTMEALGDGAGGPWFTTDGVNRLEVLLEDRDSAEDASSAEESSSLARVHPWALEQIASSTRCPNRTLTLTLNLV